MFGSISKISEEDGNDDILVFGDARNSRVEKDSVSIDNRFPFIKPAIAVLIDVRFEKIATTYKEHFVERKVIKLKKLIIGKKEIEMKKPMEREMKSLWRRIRNIPTPPFFKEWKPDDDIPCEFIGKLDGLFIDDVPGEDELGFLTLSFIFSFLEIQQIVSCLSLVNKKFYDCSMNCLKNMDIGIRDIRILFGERICVGEEMVIKLIPSLISREIRSLYLISCMRTRDGLLSELFHICLIHKYRKAAMYLIDNHQFIPKQISRKMILYNVDDDLLLSLMKKEENEFELLQDKRQLNDRYIASDIYYRIFAFNRNIEGLKVLRRLHDKNRISYLTKGETSGSLRSVHFFFYVLGFYEKVLVDEEYLSKSLDILRILFDVEIISECQSTFLFYAPLLPLDVLLFFLHQRPRKVVDTFNFLNAYQTEHFIECIEFSEVLSKEEKKNLVDYIFYYRQLEKRPLSTVKIRKKKEEEEEECEGESDDEEKDETGVTNRSHIQRKVHEIFVRISKFEEEDENEKNKKNEKNDSLNKKKNVEIIRKPKLNLDTNPNSEDSALRGLQFMYFYARNGYVEDLEVALDLIIPGKVLSRKFNTRGIEPEILKKIESWRKIPFVQPRELYKSIYELDHDEFDKIFDKFVYFPRLMDADMDKLIKVCLGQLNNHAFRKIMSRLVFLDDEVQTVRREPHGYYRPGKECFKYALSRRSCEEIVRFLGELYLDTSNLQVGKEEERKIRMGDILSSIQNWFELYPNFTKFLIVQPDFDPSTQFYSRIANFAPDMIDLFWENYTPPKLKSIMDLFYSLCRRKKSLQIMFKSKCWRDSFLFMIRIQNRMNNLKQLMKMFPRLRKRKSLILGCFNCGKRLEMMDEKLRWNTDVSRCVQCCKLPVQLLDMDTTPLHVIGSVIREIEKIYCAECLTVRAGRKYCTFCYNQI